MAEPISITAGVLGIVNTSGTLIKNLYDLGSNIKEAQSDANKVAKEVSSIAKVMESLQSYILGRAKASPQMLQYITLEDIESTLTDCVLTYSELNKLLEDLHVSTGMKAWDRAKWLLKKDRIGSFISRLQNQKASFTLMLSILQSTSMSEAERATEQLCNTVNDLFRSNQELCRRMGNLEELMRPHMGALSVRDSVSVQSSSDDDSQSTCSDETIKQKRPSLDVTRSESVTAPTAEFHLSDFEALLYDSRVYRHTADNGSTFSLDQADSSAPRSLCSSLTLDKVSQLSLFAIPVYAWELSNPEEYHIDSHITLLGAAARSGARGRKRTSKYSGVRGDLPTLWKTFRRGYPPVFGVPLEISMQYASVDITKYGDIGRSGRIPIVVAECGAFIKQNVDNLTPDCFQKELLVMYSAKVQELRNAFDSPDSYGEDIDWTRYTGTEAAQTLVQFLDLLPESIIPGSFSKRFRKPMEDFMGLTIPPRGSKLSTAELVTLYHGLIAELPTLRRDLLLHTLEIQGVYLSSKQPYDELFLKLHVYTFCDYISGNSRKGNTYAWTFEITKFLFEHWRHFK